MAIIRETVRNVEKDKYAGIIRDLEHEKQQSKQVLQLSLKAEILTQ